MRIQKCFNLNLILSGENSFWENYRHIQFTLVPLQIFKIRI